MNIKMNQTYKNIVIIKNGECCKKKLFGTVSLVPTIISLLKIFV